ncbi:MAG: hypothetical protein JRI92_05145 [Deltaproteobacteria bacterium]|nr:hypothetical protein [Deltaproteobacteria bacterium]
MEVGGKDRHLMLMLHQLFAYIKVAGVAGQIRRDGIAVENPNVQTYHLILLAIR